MTLNNLNVEHIESYETMGKAIQEMVVIANRLELESDSILAIRPLYHNKRYNYSIIRMTSKTHDFIEEMFLAMEEYEKRKDLFIPTVYAKIGNTWSLIHRDIDNNLASLS